MGTTKKYLLPILFFALLLFHVESGTPWPRDLCKGKAAYLVKDVNNAEDPLSYRVLLILPVLYRSWASARLEDLRPWIPEWELEGMFAGIEGVGAEDAWWQTSLSLEFCK